jgi:hypothetical protein
MSRYAVTIIVNADTAEEALRQIIYSGGEVIDADIDSIAVERVG